MEWFCLAAGASDNATFHRRASMTIDSAVIYGHLTLRNLAVQAEERGDRAEARRLWRMVFDACPGDAEAMARGEAAQ